MRWEAGVRSWELGLGSAPGVGEVGGAGGVERFLRCPVGCPVEIPRVHPTSPASALRISEDHVERFGINAAYAILVDAGTSSRVRTGEISLA
jgi:hypothetical protein